MSIRLRLGLRAICLAVTCAWFGTPALGQTQPVIEPTPARAFEVPQTSEAWQALDAEIRQLYSSQQYEAIIGASATLAPVLLNPRERRYGLTMRIALAFHFTNQPRQALPFFEKALPLSFNADTLRFYVGDAATVQQSARGLRFLEGLHESDGARFQIIEREKRALRFFLSVERGDRAYLAGDKALALLLYEQARRIYEPIPVPPAVQKDFIEGEKTVWDEYTYRHLYDTPEGFKKRNLEVAAFLKPKLALCQPALIPDSAAKPTVFRMAAIVIRNTDVDYTVRGRSQHQSSRLSDDDLALYKQSWRFATDALHLYSMGRLKIETEWIDLPDVSLKGLRDTQNVIAIRDLDPGALDPPQDDLFARLVSRHDGFVFVFDRGDAAHSYSGGPIRLPSHGHRLPWRAGIRSMAWQPHVNVHEFLHSMGRVLNGQRVHGPRNWQSTLAALQAQDEIDWYAFLIGSVKDWEAAKVEPKGTR